MSRTRIPRPLLLLIGDVARPDRDREGFQEVDFLTMFAPLAKWVGRVEDARRLPEYVARAYSTAMAGRPGPVVLVLPEDMLRDAVEASIGPGSTRPSSRSARWPRPL
jgi:acetolactate synthase-1/2/3 large subunit